MTVILQNPVFILKVDSVQDLACFRWETSFSSETFSWFPSSDTHPPCESKQSWEPTHARTICAERHVDGLLSLRKTSNKFASCLIYFPGSDYSEYLALVVKSPESIIRDRHTHLRDFLHESQCRVEIPQKGRRPGQQEKQINLKISWHLCQARYSLRFLCIYTEHGPDPEGLCKAW